MTYQEALVPLIEEAYSDLWRNGEKLQDKLHFKASEATRTPLELIVECATMPPFLAQTIRERKMPAMDGDPHATSGLDTVEACRQHFDGVKGELYSAIQGFPDEMLLETIDTPWGTFTWRDFISYAYWNPMYHVGQLAYVQLIHGDAEM